MKEHIQSIDNLDLHGRRVFIRVDFNVPLTPEGNISDDTRIQAALPTIRHAMEQEARIILGSHLGRPDGKPTKQLSMMPVAERLAQLLQCEVLLPDDCVGDGPRKLISNLREGQVVLLENLRFHPEEVENNEGFAKQLASFCDVYVNDAFGAAHRAHASVDALPRMVEEKAAGFLLSTEIEQLDRMLEAEDRPFVAILGGAKVSDKIGVVDRLLTRVDKILIGGAMAYTFLAAQGISLGKSLVENKKIQLAKRTLLKAENRGVEILLPTDHVCVSEISEDATYEIATNDGFPEDGIAVDIGPETVKRYVESAKQARILFWNGPMGIFEMDAFAKGTTQVADAVAHGTGFTVVGGGDSVAALRKTGFVPFIDHLSTGGGASLQYIQGRELPGIEALVEIPKRVE